jgi:hypothetical protein
MLLINDFSDFCFDSGFEAINFKKNLKENFRKDSQYTPSKKSKMSKVMSELMTSTSIKNVFEDNYSSQHVYPEEELEMKFDKEEKIFERNSPIGINENYASSKFGSEQKIQMINKELQENIKKYIYKNLTSCSALTSKGNYQEFKLDQISIEISNNLSIRKKQLSTRAECSLLFYNMLIVSQTENFYLKQSAPFGKLYISKI